MVKDDAEVVEAVEVEPEDETAGKNIEVPAPSGAPAASVPRRAPGQKEVIPLVWKVCGYSFDGVTLTLFKSVERADAEAQLARLQEEGYYTGLAIYKIDEPVPRAPQAKKFEAERAKKAKHAASDKARRDARRTVAGRSGKKKKTSTGAKGTVSAKRKPSARKPAAAVKAAPKKPAARKSSAARGAGAKAGAKTKVAAKKARSRKK